MRVLQNQSKDFIDEILNLDSNSLDEALKFEKLLADDILIKQEPEELSMAEVRDRQKKDNHNMSEYTFRQHVSPSNNSSHVEVINAFNASPINSMERSNFGS